MVMTTEDLLRNPARLAALRSAAILDTPPERDFDDLCALAALICNVPVAIVNFIDDERQWFKSEIGLGCSAPPLSVSICRHALGSDYTELANLTHDARFVDHPLVVGAPHLRFYAGASLKIEGQPVGTICILDFKPRELSEAQAKGLRTIATQIVTQIELRRKLRWQKESNAAKDEFLAKLSHELRTPLTPVLMAVSSLLETDVSEMSDAELREDLAMILRNVQLEARLIDDLLDVTRIANGKLVLKKEPVDLHAVVADALSVCAAQLRERKIVPQIALQAGRHWIEGDPARLQQVFWNLLMNAAKFTPENGRIEVTSENRGDCIEVAVRDSGRGIEPGRLESLFGAFEQGDRETTKTHGGLGLGLAICKGVVGMHGGTIRAESAGAGRGATFRVAFTLPKELAAKAAAILAPAFAV
jgi:signal transduction histidine kinase